MNGRPPDFLGLALTCALTASVVAGCGNKNDGVSDAENLDAVKGLPVGPGTSSPFLRKAGTASEELAA
jgi:hypothetical protein